MKLFFVGDICVNQVLTNPSLDSTLEELIRNADFSIGTWEAPLVNFPENQQVLKAGPHIYQHKGWEFFAEMFTHFSIANNHIMDYGQRGLESTISGLKNYQIKTFGAGTGLTRIYEPCFVQKNGINIAILGLGEAQFGVVKSNDTKTGYGWIFHPLVIKTLVELKQKADYVIVMPHAGLEMCSLPLPEWRDCYKNLIDWGADLIIGSHPHVIQGKENYKNKWIYYSLGNFFFNGMSTEPKWADSLALELAFDKTGTINIQEHFIRFDQENIHINNTADAQGEFQKNTNILSNPQQYNQIITETVEHNWQSIYKNYYAYKVTNQRFQKLPLLLQKVWNRISNYYLIEGNNLMLLHNIMIDTHRFVVERYLTNHHKLP